jgi:C4-dicarboxylate-binding protein DctP
MAQAEDSVAQQRKEKLELSNVVVFSHVVGKNTAKGRGAELLREEVKKNHDKLPNYNELQVYPDSLLFNDTKVMEALKNNTVQLAAPSISKLFEKNHRLKIFDFPFLFKDIKDIEAFYEKAKDKLFPQKYQEIPCLDDECNYLVLGLWHGGMKQLSSSQKINVSDSEPLKGQTFRIQNSDIIKFTFEKLGAKTQQEDDFAKVKKLLQKGSVTGQESTWSHIESEKFYKHQDYFIETNHGYLGYLLLSNKIFWNELQEDTVKQERSTWLKMIKDVGSTVFNESDKLNQLAKNTIKNKIEEDGKQKKKFLSLTLSEKDRNTWCKAIYNDKSWTGRWKEFIEGKDDDFKQIVQLAIEGKTGCPADSLKNKLW